MVAHVTETFAVALVGETGAGGLVDAESSEDAISVVHGTVPRTCYGCGGTGKRGIFDCGVCAGTRQLTGPPIQAHADSFRIRARRLPGPDRARTAKPTPTIRTRRRRRVPPPESDLRPRRRTIDKPSTRRWPRDSHETVSGIPGAVQRGDRHMLRRFHPLGALALAFGLAGGAQAQSFTTVVVFGDSLSDSGNVALIRSLPPGNSFTTNPDPVAAEIIAETFGASGAPSLAGGTNYATGGACVTSDPCIYRAPTIATQVDQHLLQRPGGLADPDALYTIWAGANDIESALGSNPATATAETLEAAGALAAQIRRLQNAGARHIVVYNLPDLGVTPAARAGGPAIAGGLGALSGAYNEALDVALRSNEDGIVPINVARLFEEILEAPETYGFTDVTATACLPGAVNSLACGPAGSGLPETYAPGANENHLFADGQHPSGAAHRMLAEVVTSTLAAPVQVSLAGEGAVEVAGAHRQAVAAEQASDLALDRALGSWRGYVTGGAGKREYEVLPRLGKTQSDLQVLTLGATHRAGSASYWGFALSIGNHDTEVSGADLDSTAMIGSLHGTWGRDGFHLSGALSAGRTSVDIARSISLGATTRTERGSTDAAQLGLELDLGWTFAESGEIRHGPFFGLAWLSQEVDGYQERAGSSTAMTFSGFDRDSLIAGVGYRVTGPPARVRPHIRIAYEQELEDDAVPVTASSRTMPGHFTLSGFAPPDRWASADVGVVMRWSETASAFAGYSGRFGSESLRDHRLNLGLNIVF